MKKTITEKRLCCWAGGKGRCNRIALIHITLVGIGKLVKGYKEEYDICDKHLEFKYWFYDKIVIPRWRKGILVTPIWKDKDEYKKALVKEMLEGMNKVE